MINKIHSTGSIRIFLVIAMLVIANSVQAQSIGIDVSSPDPSAILDLNDSENKRGLLVPRLSSAQRENIAAPADGLLVYDTDQKMFYHYDASVGNWQAINPFSYRQGSSAADEDNFVMNVTNNKSFVVGNVPAPTARLEVDGNIKTTSNVAVADAVSATTISAVGNVTTMGGMFQGNGTIPLGCIIMWSGQTTTIPDGWALCNGDTKNGLTTPDLRKRFVVGYSDDATAPVDYKTVGNTGGAERVTLTVNEMPSHSHAAATSPAGGHSHTMGTRGFLTNTDLLGEDEDRGVSNVSESYVSTNTSGSHSHTVFVNATTEGDQAHENLPPYYVLAFIMRVQ